MMDSLRAVIGDCVSKDADPACRVRAMEAYAAMSAIEDVECVELAMVHLSPCFPHLIRFNFCKSSQLLSVQNDQQRLLRKI